MKMALALLVLLVALDVGQCQIDWVAKKTQENDVFASLDTNKDGSWSLDEAKPFMIYKLGLGKDDADGMLMMFKKVDSNNDDKITFEEHWIGIKAKIEAEKQLFESLDINGDGSWSFDEAKIFMTRFNLDEETMKKSFERVDSNNDGKVTLEEHIKARVA